MKPECLLDYSVVAAKKTREVNLLVRLQAPEAPVRNRKPLNLGLVIDRSGSMDGEKLEKTKEAMLTLITHLSADDLLSLVVFDTHVQALRGPEPVADKDALRRLVGSIRSGSSTNLSGGWLKGVDLVASKSSPDRIDRVLLLTDGMANAGITDIGQLVAFGQDVKAKQGIATTTLGFGNDFQEDLLTAVARESGGHFYFIESADQAPEVFREELQGLLSLAAQNVEVRLTPAAAVSLAVQWTAFPSRVEGEGMVFNLGDVYSGERKSLLVGLLVPELDRLGAAPVAVVETVWAQIRGDRLEQLRIRQDVAVEVADETSAAGAAPDIDVLRQVNLQRAAKARLDAIREADAGDYDRARSIVAEAERQISAQAALAEDPSIQAEMADLRESGRMLEDRSEYQATRKCMSTTAHYLTQSCSDQLTSYRTRRRRRSGNPSDAGS